MLRCETGRVTTVTLDRPPANALDTAAFEELIEVLARLPAAPHVRPNVITGTGPVLPRGPRERGGRGSGQQPASGRRTGPRTPRRTAR